MKKTTLLVVLTFGLAASAQANPLAKTGHAIAHVFKKISHGFVQMLGAIQAPTER